MEHIDDSLLILTQVINNKSYYKKVIQHLKPEYFEFDLDKKIFTFLDRYSKKYGDSPTPLIVKNALSRLELNNDADRVQYISDFVKLIEKEEVVPLTPMMDKTEEYIKNKALENAIYKTISIYKGETDQSKESIPEIIKDALAVTLDESVGEFYFEYESAKKRRDSYNNPVNKIPFKLKKCNEVTNNGVMRKALHCFVGAPNVGKTAWLISLASDYVELGLDVLYVTLEMSEDQIGIRFDSRFLGHETSEIPKMDEYLYFNKLENLKNKSGKLVIKEYPTNEFTAMRLESLLDELYTKSGFKPDAVFVDYLGICSSYYLKDRGNIGTYYTKVAEEFRSCAQKKDFALWTAQQMTTDALDNTDPTLKHIGYGQGIAKTADMVWFGIRTEDLDQQGQILIKQDKTRYHKERVVRFPIGFDIGFMKMYDSELDMGKIALSTSVDNSSSEPQSTDKASKINTAFNNIKMKKPLNGANIKV